MQWAKDKYRICSNKWDCAFDFYARNHYMNIYFCVFIFKSETCWLMVWTMVKALWKRNSMLPRFLVALWDANCWPNQFLEHSRSGSLTGQQRKRLTVNRIHLWIEWSTLYIRSLVSASECVAWSLVITPWSLRVIATMSSSPSLTGDIYRCRDKTTT